jgi:hypothetical protein
MTGMISDSVLSPVITVAWYSLIVVFMVVVLIGWGMMIQTILGGGVT